MELPLYARGFLALILGAVLAGVGYQAAWSISFTPGVGWYTYASPISWTTAIIIFVTVILIVFRQPQFLTGHSSNPDSELYAVLVSDRDIDRFRVEIRSAIGLQKARDRLNSIETEITASTEKKPSSQ